MMIGTVPASPVARDVIGGDMLVTRDVDGKTIVRMMMIHRLTRVKRTRNLVIIIDEDEVTKSGIVMIWSHREDGGTITDATRELEATTLLHEVDILTILTMSP